MRLALVSQDHAPRVLREALALARLDHPHICRYYTAWLQTDWRSLQTSLQTKVGNWKPPPPPPPSPGPSPDPDPYPQP